MDLSILDPATSGINSLADGINSFLPAGSTVTPPSSQKAGDRPISFILHNRQRNSYHRHDLIIRPEELTRTETSRTTVQQTLGGAWIDDFGAGLPTINISGHTGWRGNVNGDGMALFADLKGTVFDAYHLAKKNLVAKGIDPSKISLDFVDTLDSTIDTVVPMTFALRRSKSRPLLMQFNMSLLVVNSDIIKAASPSANPLASFLSSINNLLSAIKNVVKFVSSQIAQVTAFLQTVTSIFQTVSNLITSIIALPKELIGAVKSLANAGTNMFATIANVAGNTSAQSAAAMSASSAFSNIFCLLNNTVNQQITYPDYTPLYGASNCSSTNGGSPLSPYANTNPFYAATGHGNYAAAPAVSASTAPVVAGSSTPVPTISVNSAATQALAVINNSDPVFSPLSMQQIGVVASTIASGVTIK